MKSDYLLRLLVSTLLLCTGLVQAAVTVSVDRNPVRVNESFQLNFEADETVDGDPDFSPLQQHFQILNRSQSNNISIIDGKYQRSMKWTLQVMPRQTGDFMLPAIKFGSQKSKPFQLAVKPESPSKAQDNDGVIFEILSDESSLYVQSQVLVTLRLMSDSSISGYQMGDLVIDDMDVVVEALGDFKQYQTRLDDKPYLVLEKRFALFPQQSGTLTIAPILAEVQYGSRFRSIFDPFQARGEVRRVRSKKLVLEVLATPESYNASNWLPSASVELSEDWQGDLNRLNAGEPVTRIITLTAQGLTAAQLPELLQMDIPGIKQYLDKPVFEDQRSAGGINGIRRQRTAIIPTGAGRYTLPEIIIPWWNLKTGQQEVTRIPPRTIEVQRAMDINPPSEPGSQISPITADSVNNIPVLQPEADRFWLWLSVILGAGWISSILLWWFSRKGLFRSSSTSANAVSGNLTGAKKRLHLACASNNASAARDAVLNWANALKINRRFANLNQVTQYFGNPLKRDIDILNRHIYSESTDKWNGDSLWRSCEQLTSDRISPLESVKPGGLYPLNP